jgi:3-deoxy-7-phosphoheptulonate synthase
MYEDLIANNSVFISHEGLLLNYEECFLRNIENDYYDLSGHFLWIGIHKYSNKLSLGERTNSIDEAHVEFFRGVKNPVGIKVSSRTNLDNLIGTIKILNPKNKKGKIVLITRFGLDSVPSLLEAICKNVAESGVNVLFVCDPNHGNTKVLENGKKVRFFDDIKKEIILTNRILQNNGQFLSGMHIESSCFHVTECIGGFENKVESIEEENYTTFCDPRLNMQQVINIY